MRVKYAKEKNSISYIFKPVEMTAEQFSKWNSETKQMEKISMFISSVIHGMLKSVYPIKRVAT